MRAKVSTHPNYHEAIKIFTDNPHDSILRVSRLLDVHRSTLAWWVNEIRFAAGAIQEKGKGPVDKFIPKISQRKCNRCKRPFKARDNLHTCDDCKRDSEGMEWGYAVRL